MTRDLRLVLILDGQEMELDRAELDDDQPLTASGVARGLHLTADRIEAWSEYRRRFQEITEGLEESA